MCINIAHRSARRLASTLDDDLMLTIDDTGDLQLFLQPSFGSALQVHITRIVDGHTQWVALSVSVNNPSDEELQCAPK